MGFRWVAFTFLSAAPWTVHAGRPMVTDDTATASRGDCQIELWSNHLADNWSHNIAPACGLTDALELDLQGSSAQGSAGRAAALALGLKWAPEALVYSLPLGTLSLGVKAGGFWTRNAADRWRHEGPGLVALASLTIGPSLTLSANLGTTRSLSTHNTSTGFNLGAAWQPNENWLLFAEWLGTDHAAGIGNAGLRWWILPGTLALDFSAGRAAGLGAVFSLGLGWYKIRLP